MTRAFIAIALLSFKNRIVSRVRRLRDPRYAAGALFGLVYFGWIFFRNQRSAMFFRSGAGGELRVDLVSVAALVLMLFAWALPGDSGGLEFSEAEIAFLFPAPLRRRDLLLYKIIRSQPQVITSVAIFTLLGATRSKFVGLWLAFSVMSVYMMLVALGRARLRQLGANFVVRLVAVVAIAAGIGVVCVSALKDIELHPGPNIAAELHPIFRRTPLAQILFLPRAFAGAVFPSSLTMLAVSSAVLLVFGVVVFFVADRLNVSFEEGSVVRAQKKHEMVQRMRARRGGGYVMFKRARAPFRLAPTGPPETAIVWKNTVATMRMSAAMLVIIPLIFALLMGVAVFVPDSRGGVGVTMMMWTILLPFVGPNIFANDLRLDLPRLEVLKSYPLSGQSIVGAEIAAPLVLIASLELLSIGCAWAVLAVSDKLSSAAGAQFAICALLLAVPIVALQLLLRNAVPVIFPAWATRAKEDARGFVLTGQRLLLVMGNLVALAFALIPAGLIFLPSIWIAVKFFGGNMLFMAILTMPAVAVICGEVWLGVQFLGERFEALDVSEEFDTIAV